ncbi:restriction endonuclease type II-like protein [Gorgonomyces haynaldii]|nr:restriction endonuclease type II-like protein [Gorgonomyces haynaldii]
MSVKPFLVNVVQKSSPLLRYIKAFEIADIPADFMVGDQHCCLYLSLKYHSVHPEYIYIRLRKLGDGYRLRILLVVVDVDQPKNSLVELTKTCLDFNMTLILAWSDEEAAKYLETFKLNEHKPPDLIKESVKTVDLARLTSALTEIKSINKTDVLTLQTNYKSLYDIIHAPAEQINLLPGFGESKTKRLMDAFDAPFCLES